MPDTSSSTATSLTETSESPRLPEFPGGTTAQILPAVSFTFVCYLSIGIPLAILPPYVHLQLGYGTILAGLVISVQYIATVLSRPRAGRMIDAVGPKRVVVYGLLACAGSGVWMFAAAFFNHLPYVALLLILLGRLMLGVGESMVGTGASIWGIGRAGSQHIAKVISWNGVATFGALSVGAPLGVVLHQRVGFGAAGILILLLSLAAAVLALRLPRIPVPPSRHLPFAHIFWRVAPHGTALAFGGMGFGVLATFITLYFATLHWSGAAFTLSLYGVSFVCTRLLFAGLIPRLGGFPVAIVSLFIEVFGLLLLGFARVPSAAFAAAALIGFGFSLVFPSLAVEAVRHIPVENRGTALGTYNLFVDLSLFLAGPLAGAIISHAGYRPAFLSCAGGVFFAFCLTILLASRHHTPIST
ncbi:MAG TPA: MFS transporter [Candidatus Sulfotelmatobacter sp.]|jgi:MFS family permease|nr:MFS transporter [Candidatus Sulfotelmatobacter sp.]